MSFYFHPFNFPFLGEINIQCFPFFYLNLRKLNMQLFLSFAIKMIKQYKYKDKKAHKR